MRESRDGSKRDGVWPMATPRRTSPAWRRAWQRPGIYRRPPRLAPFLAPPLFADDFFAAFLADDFLPEDFLPEVFLAEDFFAEDLFAGDFLA